MLLDRYRVTRERHRLHIVDRELIALFVVHGHVFRRYAGQRFGGVDHFQLLAAELSFQNRSGAALQTGLEHVELVRVDRALHHVFAQAVGGGDEDDVAKAAFGIQREHDPGGGQIGTHHFLHCDGQGHVHVIEPVVGAVADGAIREQ